MYDRGFPTRLHGLTATLFNLEETRMSNGPAYVMNGHICFALWDDYLVILVGNESASELVGEDDLQNCIAITMLFTFALPPKTVKQTPKKTSRKAD
jgi:hypothetical protein